MPVGLTALKVNDRFDSDQLAPCPVCEQQPRLSRRPPKQSVGVAGDYLIECGCVEQESLFVNYSRTEAIERWNKEITAEAAR